MAEEFPGTAEDDVEVGSYQKMYGKAGDDSLTSTLTDTMIEIYGGGGNDFLVYLGGSQSWLNGGAGNDSLVGGPQYDWLVGGKGNDWFFGRQGNDFIKTGPGRDHIGFNTQPNSNTNRDTVDDFDPDKDLFHFNLFVFDYTKDFSPGEIKAGNFRVGPKAKDGNDFFGHDRQKDVVWTDLNANDPGGFFKVADVDDGLSLTYLHFRLD
jgi:Ca2+-binding RTX toxin-like protein